MQKNWVVAPLPANEEERLEALKRYRVLDSAAEESFDRITRLASLMLKTPVALISLIDKDRQWFKSKLGLEARETPRDLAFCAHAILEDRVLVVENAMDDPRFAGNPLVAGNPDIRFYAGAPLKTPDGYHLGTLCVIDREPHYNVTEQQEAILRDLAAIAIDELELRNAIREERRANLAKRDFLANISHEIRTPMNCILGMAHLLDDTPLDHAQREYVETINYSAKNLLLLLNDTLDFSKIEAEELRLEETDFSVREIFQKTADLFKPLAREKGLEFHCTADASLPARSQGDPGRVAQILNNLFSNALKFTEKGSVRATLTCREDSKELYGEVVDTGIGIPPANQPLIFEKFAQADTSITRKYGGTGLGLSITRHLLRLMGGDIGFESESNRGTRFWFTLPLRATAEIHLLPSISVAPPVNALPASEARILVAEDHPVNQFIITRMIRKLGFSHIDTAENGEEVLQKMHDTAYDAVLMDCRMPVKDGYDTALEIRERELDTRRHVLIFAITANVLAGERERCLLSGMDDYIAKPVEPAQLKRMLGKWFCLSQTARDAG